MIRRRFLSLMTFAGATGVTALTKAVAFTGERKTVVYRVSGFTCITCATGLETLLGREKGVLAVSASYAQAEATVSYDAHLTTQASIRSAIESMGFTAHVLSEELG